MNKKILVTPIVSAIAMPTIAFADLNAEFAGALICANPEGFSVMACNMGGKSTLNLYARGKGLVSIDESSLKLTKLRVGKQNLLTNSAGKSNYEIGFGSGIEQDGTLAEFDIVLKSGLKKIDGAVSVKGTLTAYTGSGEVTKESPLFDPTNYKEMKVGPATIKARTKTSPNSDGTSRADIIESLKQKGVYSEEHINLFFEMIDKGIVTKDKSLPELDKELRAAYPNIDENTKRAIGPMVMTYTLDNVFNFAGDDTQIAINIDVDEKSVEEIELMNATGKTIESEGVMTTNGVKSYLFAKTDAKKVKLVVRYQKDLEPVKIKINL